MTSSADILVGGESCGAKVCGKQVVENDDGGLISALPPLTDVSLTCGDS